MTAPIGLALPIARLHLTARAEAPLHLPPYAGSMLRGAWGHALLALSPLPHADGKPCALQASCPYCQVFAPPPLPGHGLQKFSQMPAPFVIEPPPGGAQRLAAGQTFGFGLVLIGKALAHLPTLLLAWERALHTGLGVQRSRCTLLEIIDETSRLPLTGHGKQLCFLKQPIPAATPLSQHATLELTSPLRLQLQGKPVKAQALDARTLLITLARRWQLLQDTHLGTAAAQQDFAQLSTQASAITLQGEDVRWFDWGRYSQHQQQEMKLGGLLGRIHLHGDLSAFATLLHLGQWLHVGKNASFGLGGYRLSTSFTLPSSAFHSAQASGRNCKR